MAPESEQDDTIMTTFGALELYSEGLGLKGEARDLGFEEG